MTDEEDSLDSGSIFRLQKPQGISFYPYRARIEDFIPSSEDKQVAQETGRPVLVSVFDCTLTTFPQGCLIRGIDPIESLALVLEVVAVLRLSSPRSGRRLRVLRDPIDSSLPGALGHCGIEGLGGSQNVMAKEDRRFFRAKLANAARAVPCQPLPPSPP